MDRRFNLKGRISGLGIRSLLLLCTLILEVILMAAAVYFSYDETTDVVMKSIEKGDEGSLVQVNNRMGLIFDEMLELTRNISDSEALISMLEEYSNSNNDSYNRNKMYQDITSWLIKTKMYYGGIDFIGVFAGENSFFSKGILSRVTFKEIADSSMYGPIKASPGNPAIFAPFFDRPAFTDTFTGITFANTIFSNGKELGIVVLVMNRDWLEDVFGKDPGIFLGTRSGRLISGGGAEGIFPAYYDITRLSTFDSGKFIYRYGKENYKISYIQSKYNDWILLQCKRIADVLKPLNVIRYMAIIAAIISMAISILLSRLISSKITKPFNRLASATLRYLTEGSFTPVAAAEKKKSFRDDVLIYIVAVTVIPLLLFNLTFFPLSYRIIDSNARDSVLAAFRQTKENVDYFIDKSSRRSVRIIFNPYVQNYLAARIKGEKSGLELTRYKLYKELDMQEYGGLYDANLYGVDGKLLFSTSTGTSGTMDATLFKEASAGFGECLWTYDMKARQLVLVRKVWGITIKEYATSAIGYLEIRFHEMNLENLYKDMELGGSVYITDGGGRILSHKSKSLLGKPSAHNPALEFTGDSGGRIMKTGGSKFFSAYTTFSKLPWYLAGEIPYDDISMGYLRSIAYNLVFQAILILLALIAAYRLSLSFTGSIGRLNGKLLEFNSGNSKTDFLVNSRVNEVDELCRTFNTMASRIDSLVREIFHVQLKEKEMESKKKDAERIALQAQINPHFLYNTLDSIRWMILEGEKDKAAEMIASLGDLFRLGISNEKRFVTIAEEINYTKAYNHIQKQRFGKRLQVDWHVDESLLGYFTPKLILQPIIENSIYHGIQARAGGGRIDVYCGEEQDRIVFTINDNGAGMDDARLEEIRKGLKGLLPVKSIGMFNVNKLLGLYFGEDFGITVRSRQGMGTSVRMEIPKIPENPGEQN